MLQVLCTVLLELKGLPADKYAVLNVVILVVQSKKSAKVCVACVSVLCLFTEPQGSGFLPPTHFNFL